MTDHSNYKVIQTVASGGTAVLYKAIQVSLDRVVALKRLHQHLTTDENFTRRFVLEAKAAASLDHENIVRVIDFGVEDGEYQMVMEFVEGESLREVLDRWRPINHDIALAIAHQICRGLEHAHAKGIVHRDIKPGNIMVTKSGVVKITDFGLAKLTQGSTVQTASESILGTPLYMSPEQAFGESVDQRSDLFSLGTVLYELFTGRQPFAGENYMGVIQNILKKEIPNIREVNPNVPEGAEEIVGKALARNREERFQSARAFREAIERLLGIEGLNRSLGMIPVLLERNTDTRMMLRSGTSVATGSPLRHRKSPSSAMARRKPKKRPWVAIMALTLLAGCGAGYFLVGPGRTMLTAATGIPAVRPMTQTAGMTDGLDPGMIENRADLESLLDNRSSDGHGPVDTIASVVTTPATDEPAPPEKSPATAAPETAAVSAPERAAAEPVATEPAKPDPVPVQTMPVQAKPVPEP
ncbi:MAG TPA: serine/threonine-protein kinase, partial [Candidatus Krumholzibacteria bacterium]|nr:serine/threonine-protein kinase [Candidatus Krumholzibacteria bacterium]